MNFLGNAPNLKEQRGNEEDLASGIDRSIGVSERDGVCESFSGDFVFSHKAPIDAGDICSTVYFCSGVDNSKGLFIREEGD